MKSKFLLNMSILIMALAFLSPLPALGAAELPRSGGVFVTVLNSDPTHFLAPATVDASISAVGSQLFPALLKLDLDMNPLPWIAESWSASNNGSTVTFNLIKNATWTDGAPITSADVKFSLENVTPFNPAGFLVLSGPTGAIASVEAPDDYTVVINLNSHQDTIFKALGMIGGGIVPKHIYELTPGPEIFTNTNNFDAKVTGGPFILLENVPGDHITLVKNPNYYYKGKPYLDQVIFKIIPEPSSAVLAYMAGEVDYLGYGGLAPAGDLVSLAERSDTEMSLEFQALAGQHYMSFNLDDPILNNTQVRKALATATDLETINQLAWGITGKVPQSHLHQDIAFSVPTLSEYAFDLSKANAILDAAGYPKGSDGFRFSLEFTFRQETAGGQKAADILQQHWKNIGVDLTVVPLEGGAHGQKVYTNRDFQITMDEHPSGPDAGLFWDGIFLSFTARLPFPGTNTAAFINEEVDGLIFGGKMTSDPAQDAEIYDQLLTILADQLPTFPLNDGQTIGIYRNTFVGLPAGPAGSFRVSYDNIWWTLGNEPVMTTTTQTETKINTETETKINTETETKINTETMTGTVTETVTNTQTITSTKTNTITEEADVNLYLIGIAIALIIAVIAIVYAVRKK
mgnify:CR=1 FL=1